VTAVWGFVTVNRPAPKLFDAEAHEALESLGDFNSHHIVTAVWAFAAHNHPAHAVAHIAFELLGVYNSQITAYILWAFASFTRPAPKLLDAVAHEALECLGDCNSQETANTVAHCTVAPSQEIAKVQNVHYISARRLRYVRPAG